MSILNEITKEKQRVSEALARVDAQREKLTGQLGELDATERVLARYSKGRHSKESASAATTANSPVGFSRSRALVFIQYQTAALCPVPVDCVA